MYRNKGISGISFVLTGQDPFVAIYHDECLSRDGISQLANEVPFRIWCYTEVSPSVRGLRLLVSYADFVLIARRPLLEVYTSNRFVTVTGNHVEGCPTSIVAVTPDALLGLLPDRQVQAIPSSNEQMLPAPLLNDSDLWEQIFVEDRFGAEHRRRFEGDMSLDEGDHSLTVIRLLNCLAGWTGGNAQRMRAMMLLSPLANEKWASKRGKADWLDYQIHDAIRFSASGRLPARQARD